VSKRVEFFFDFGSPTAYLAWTQLPGIAMEARAEIVEGKRRLEEITDAPVTLFAYPNGKPGRDYGPRDVELVRRAGFAAAVSTRAGAANRASDLFQLPRFTPWDKSPRRFGMRLLANCVRSVPA